MKYTTHTEKQVIVVMKCIIYSSVFSLISWDKPQNTSLFVALDSITVHTNIAAKGIAD